MKKYLDIEVYVESDYVYMSTRDWQKVVKILSSISDDNFDIKKIDPEIISQNHKTLQ